YPTIDYLNAERRTYDYTPRLEHAELGAKLDGSVWPPTGGADQFLDFIEAELKPFVQEKAQIDLNQQAIFGHSFGGLCVLHALFTRPGLFHAYIAASPSIWFAPDKLDGEFDRLVDLRRASDVGRRLLITVGQDEQSSSFQDSAASSDRIHWRQRNRMVENACEMATRISERPLSGIDVTFNAFEDENHASVLPAAISRAIRFAFAGPRGIS
ncbi:MAG TPA: alpha/beta hydrolase-fold protein, partial [Tepidisphaeraceae bacterium]|nr:alpha/beta hydrolase-fold protein [Tepidisphaeraceae bacterium]